MRMIRLLALCCAASPLLSCTEGTAPAVPADGASSVWEMTRAKPTVVTDLGPRASGGDGCSGEQDWQYEYSAAFDVNEDGVIVGETLCIAQEYLTFRWHEGIGMQQLANYPGGYQAIGGSINKTGNIAAAFNENSIAGYYTPIIWTPANARIDLAPGISADVSDINDNDEVVGVGSWGATRAAYRWTPATGLVALPALGSRRPVAINRKGDIAAVSTDGTAILSKNGALTLISGLQAQDLNAQGEVVGATGTWPATTATIWSRAKGIRGLGTLGGVTSYAYGINNRSEVVGVSTTSSGEVHAFYWRASRGMVDLGPGEGYAISDKGHMVGMAPIGLVSPWGGEVWHATLWRGTGGVAASPATARAGAAPTVRAAACFNDATNWQSKTRMFRCLAGKP